MKKIEVMKRKKENKMVRLTESDLHRVIKESVKKVIKEGTTSEEDSDLWERMMKDLGPETILNELFSYLSSDDIHDFIEHVDRYYEMGYFDDSEEDEDDY